MQVKVNGKISVNDADAYIHCAVKGFGLIQAPRFMLLPHLESGALREILPQWEPAPMPISVVYLQNRHLSPKVRAFVDWVAELFPRCPLFSGRDAEFLQSECTFASAGKAEAHSMRTTIEHKNVAEAVY
jgi:LysR family transcriptional regulator for bpeEF and oprC